MSQVVISPPGIPEGPASIDVREAILSLWDEVEMAKSLTLNAPVFKRKAVSGFLHSWQDFRAILMYAVENPSRRKRQLMNVDDMVNKWVPIVRSLSTSHDKAPLDQTEFEMEQYLVPLLSAPVKQIRDFYNKLTIALKADPTIPFFIWAWFESWGEVILKRAPDAEIKQLKTVLATEIADLVEEDVKPDLKKAIAGALQWRSQESLEKVKSAVQQGAKARMVGKESCLFLEVDLPDGELARVML